MYFKSKAYILLISMIVLLGCEANHSTIISSYDVNTLELDMVGNETGNDLIAYEYPLKVEEGYSLWDQTIYGSTIYYIVAEQNQSNHFHDIQIIAYDIDSGNTDVIYKYQNEKVATFYTELRATEDYLFFVETPLREEVIIYKLDLNSGELSELWKRSNAISPAFSVTENYVAWYENPMYEEGDATIILNVYSIATDSIKVIEDDVTKVGPYDRPHITDHHIVYFSPSTEPEEVKVIISHLLTDERKEIITTGEIVNTFSNGRFTVWRIGYSSSNVFVFDHEQDELYSVDFAHNKSRIFSLCLVNNTMFINFSMDGDGYPNIYSVDLIQNKIQNITQNKHTGKSYVLATVTADQRLLSQTFINHEGIAVIIE